MPIADSIDRSTNAF